MQAYMIHKHYIQPQNDKIKKVSTDKANGKLASEKKLNNFDATSVNNTTNDSIISNDNINLCSSLIENNNNKSSMNVNNLFNLSKSHSYHTNLNRNNINSNSYLSYKQVYDDYNMYDFSI